MKRRDKRKRRKKRDELKARSSGLSNSTDRHLVPSTCAETVRVIRDSNGRMYIKAPDGSNRRADKVSPEKLNWLSEA